MAKIPISEYSLSELFGDSLTSTLCVNVEKGTKAWVVMGMLVHSLESFTDAVVVREQSKPIGIVGGKDMIERLVDNATSDFFDKTLVENIMEKKVPTVSKQTKLKELIDFWKQTRRAVAMVPNEFSDYSAISAKKMLEVGKKCKTDVSISEIPEKKIATFNKNFTIKDVIDSMLTNGTRRLLLDDFSKFINDRIILEKITEDLNYLRGTENFLSIPVTEFKLEDSKKVSEDMTIPEVSKIMYEMEHPYVIFKNQVVSPWDICLILLSDRITEI